MQSVPARLDDNRANRVAGHANRAAILPRGDTHGWRRVDVPRDATGPVQVGLRQISPLAETPIAERDCGFPSGAPRAASRSDAGCDGTIQRCWRSFSIVQLKRETLMNWDTVKGKWTQAVGSAKSKWGELTDDDLQQVDGERDKLVGKVQERYGIAKAEAERQVDEWAEKV
jgi:uncharacterized protein YjbJ (UPF0337 family)